MIEKINGTAFKDMVLFGAACIAGQIVYNTLYYCAYAALAAVYRKEVSYD